MISRTRDRIHKGEKIDYLSAFLLNLLALSVKPSLLQVELFAIMFSVYFGAHDCISELEDWINIVIRYASSYIIDKQCIVHGI